MDGKALTFAPISEKRLIAGIIILDVLMLAAIALTSPLIALAIVFGISLLFLFYLPRMGYIYFLIIWLPYEGLVISDDGEYEFYRLTVLVLLMILAWFKFWLSRNKIKYPPKVVYYPIIALYIWSAITVLLSPYPLASLIAYLRLITYLAMFILIYNLIESEKDLRHLIFVSLIALIPTFMATFYQFIFLGIGRARGFAHNPNTLSMYAVLAVALAIMMYQPAKKELKNILASAVLFMISLMALLCSGARASLLSFMVLIITYLLLSKNYRLLSGLLIVTILVAIEIYSQNPLFSNYARAYRLYSGSTGRTLIWQTALPMILDHPIFGVGFGGVGKVITNYMNATNPIIGFHLKEVLENGLLHNGYIQKAAEIGLTGLIFYLVANFMFMMYLWKIMRSSLDMYIKHCATVSLAFMFASLAYALVESSVHFGPLWTHAGVMVILTAILKNADSLSKISNVAAKQSGQ